METLKRVDEVQQPDERSLMWVYMDTRKRVPFEDRYSQIARIDLDPAVPDALRSYFATIQNLCVYGWFAYDLYALVRFLSYTFIEMALRLRFPVEGRDRRGLYDLLDEAIKSCLLQEKAFSHMRENRRQLAFNLRLERQIEKIPRSSVPKVDYLQLLLRMLPKQRNARAHPRGQEICLPGDAIFALRLAADLVNQLFTPPSKKQRLP